MNIILDANILIADYRLEGAAFVTFVENLQGIDGTVWVPQVVVDEVINKHKEALEKLASDSDAVSRMIRRLTGREVRGALPSDAVGPESDAYKEFLSSKFHEYKFRVMRYPSTSHESLVARAVERRKPFGASGAGYRDALIWESILFLARENSVAIAFLTRNLKDFGGDKGLDERLAEELVSIGRSASHVTLFQSIEEFNSGQIFPRLVQPERLAELLRNDEFPSFSIFKWVEINLLEKLNNDQIARAISVLAPSRIDCELLNVTDVPSCEIDDIRVLSEGDYVVFATTEISLDVRVEVDRSNYLKHSDVRDYIGWNPQPFEVFAEDRVVSATVGFSIILTKEKHEVRAFGLDFVESSFGRIDLNEHPEKAI